MFRIGIDIGGTFTDFAMRGASDQLYIHKQLTTPDDPARAMIEGIQTLASRHGVPIGEIDEIVHGTTLVTNAIIERKGAKVGVLVTKGFSDVLDVGTEYRYDLFDLRARYAKALVTRRLRREITERVQFDGSISIKLEDAEVLGAIESLVAEGITALAICFLHSYANPAHEQQARQLAATHFPSLHLSTSSDVFSSAKEYERWTTTTMNAYAQPVVAAYLNTLERGLATLGFAGRLTLMSSSGGIITPETARRYPVRMLESGPAAGILMAAEMGRRIGLDTLLAFDLGGTTAKGAIVKDGRPLRTYGMEVARCYYDRRGSGLPARIPVINMTEIGSGGGSIARIDEVGLLKMGPQSAGADPGPACYGRGGDAATLTDANVVLGYLDPEYFLGGKMRLDKERAVQSTSKAVADPLDVSVVQAAFGMHETINEDIARAFRVHSAEQGLDLRNATMIAFGGGGPVHGASVARKLKVPRVIFPPGAGVMAAQGLLLSPSTFEVVRTLRVDLASLTSSMFRSTLSELSQEASRLLIESGVKAVDVAFERRLDMRYVGQGYELELTLPASLDEDAIVEQLPALFAAKYRATFGIELTSPIELIAWKVEARGPQPSYVSLQSVAASRNERRSMSRRAIHQNRTEITSDAAVYDRYQLAPGTSITGPAVIEEAESTCILGANDVATVDRDYNIVVEISL